MARKRAATVAAGSGGGARLEADAVGFPTALATAVGLIIASSVLLTATTGFGVGGWVFAVAILIAYVLMVFQSMSFAEASGIMPLAGSVYDYITAGLGRFLGVTGTLVAYLVVHLFAGTAETAAAGLFAGRHLPLPRGHEPRVAPGWSGSACCSSSVSSTPSASASTARSRSGSPPSCGSR